MTDAGWFKNATVYHILIDRFAGVTSADRQQPEFLGGNIQGILKKLDYLQDLGVDTLWLSPFYRTSVYHGYHVTDFMEVEPRFGTLTDVTDLIQAVHAAGMRIIADFVPNHCSSRHPFFHEATHDKASRYRSWFIFNKWPHDYRCFLGVRELPKLNLRHSETRRYVIRAAEYWLAAGFDGFRLDHVLGPPHTFWHEFRKAIKTDFPRAVLLGEAWFEGIQFNHLKTLQIRNKYLRWLLGISQESIQKEYVGELDGVLDFQFQNLMKIHIAHGPRYDQADSLRPALQHHYGAYPSGFFLAAFLDNHDMNRFLFECEGDIERLKAAATLQFGVDQPVVIYYGTEAGMTHNKPVVVNTPHSDLEARRPMVWNGSPANLFLFYKDLIKKRKNVKKEPTP
ncbi:MAG: alpha-amylase family glycosyl hydrolase [Thermodesulfobacteriota bacterium]